MSFITMTEANKEYVTGLYGLKASLLMLSEEARRLKAAEARESTMREGIEIKQGRISDLQKKSDEAIEKKDSLAGRVRKCKGATIRNVIIGSVLLVIGTIGVLPVALASFLVSLIGNPILTIAAIVSGAVILLSALIAGIILLITGIFNRKRRQVKREIAALDDIVAVNKAEIDHITSLIENEDAIYKLHVDNLKATCKDCTVKSKAIYDATYIAYNDLLGADDWVNLDYIIYAYVNHMADSLSKAHDNLEIEIRQQNLTAAIELAAKDVQRNLTVNFDALGAPVGAQMVALARIIDQNNTQSVAAISEASANVSALATALREGKTENNVLLNKANVTSIALANDLKYLFEKQEIYGNN